MRPLSREEVRRVDTWAIGTLGVCGLVLMENAGRACADEIERFFASRVRSLAVVAGAGNNGGDGFVIARHLAMRGWKTATFLIAPEDKLSDDAAANFRILRGLGHDLRTCTGAELDELGRRLAEFDVVVDAVGGTGIRGALRGDLARCVEQINAAGRPVVAVDIPTGLDCDTGLAEGPAVRAVLTITMVASKKGFGVPGATQYTGEVRVVDIGVPPGNSGILA